MPGRLPTCAREQSLTVREPPALRFRAPQAQRIRQGGRLKQKAAQRPVTADGARKDVALAVPKDVDEAWLPSDAGVDPIDGPLSFEQVVDRRELQQHPWRVLCPLLVIGGLEGEPCRSGNEVDLHRDRLPVECQRHHQ